jgi:prophage antirepressor-like protein
MSHLKTLENPFQFETLDVRTAVDENNDVWFCAKDVCQVLDIEWTGHTLDNMPENWFMVVKLTTIKGERDANFINEAGLYRLIFRSNKPKAEEFANWVCEEVLPQIRKNGYFGKVSAKDYIAIVKQIDQLTTRLINSKNAFTHALLVNPLKNLCNMAGHPMPDIQLISQTLEQDDLFADDAQKKLAGAK